MANLIKEARYIMSNVDHNNNKYWYAFLYDDGTFETHWNRVGETPNKTIKTGFNESQFNSKCREKEKKGYKLLDTLADGGMLVFSSKTLSNEKLKEVAKTQIKHNDPLVEKLIIKLTEANIHNIIESGAKLSYNNSTGLFSTPLGIVTQSTVDEARDILGKIGQYIINNDMSNNIYKQLFNDYCMHIPQDVGRQKLNPYLIFPDINAVYRQGQILDDLEVSIKSVIDGVSKPDNKITDSVVFKTKLGLVNDGQIYDRITKKFLDTLHSYHASSHLRPKVIYSVEIEDMKESFEKKGKPIGNLSELWHGSRVGNCLSILSKGLMIMGEKSSLVNGSLFGRGLYFANSSSKSLNYSYGYWDGKSKDNNPYMFLADVAMGKSYTPKNTYEQLPKFGYDSTFAKANISGVINDEIVIYNTYQCNPIYLIEFSPGGR